eukprot:119976-Pyramimonas_sp.AAC.1
MAPSSSRFTYNPWAQASEGDDGEGGWQVKGGGKWYNNLKSPIKCPGCGCRKNAPSAKWCKNCHGPLPQVPTAPDRSGPLAQSYWSRPP